MGAALHSADAVTWLSIVVKTVAYGATLGAVGSVLVLAVLRTLSDDGRAALRRLAALLAVTAAMFSALRLPVRASFLMGGTWGGAADPVILGMVADSPLGTSVAARVAGLALILCVGWRGRVGIWIALAGALIASASFALRGHALDGEQAILGGLITLHILGLAFWVGAFAPLARSARAEDPARAGALAYEFGRRAVWVVGLLVLAGAITLIRLGAATPAVLSSAYGQFFLIKLAVFGAVLALAAVNKLWLTPALMASAPGAGARLRRSVGVEAALVGAILITTATLTTLSAPPGAAQDALATGPIPPPTRAQQDFGGSS